jgi:hypothetical protein
MAFSLYLFGSEGKPLKLKTLFSLGELLPKFVLEKGTAMTRATFVIFLPKLSSFID